MALKLDDIDFKVKLPELPRSVPLYRTSAPSLEERSRAMEVLGKTLGLDGLRPVELAHSVIFASRRGEVEYFPASGALWARSAEADQRHENELRDWPGLVETRERDDRTFELRSEIANRMLDQARTMLAEANLVSDAMTVGELVLDQVTELDVDGKEISRGAGAATARFGYALLGLEVVGAGAKSLAYLEPERDRPTITGMFHAWRPIVGDVVLPLPAIEDALAVGLGQDPELSLYRERGHRIEVTHLAFAYMALPATIRQMHLFPVFQIEGRAVDPRQEENHFFFGRYHHAATPEQYRKADVFADYLARMN